MWKKTSDLMVSEINDKYSKIYKPYWFKDQQGIGTIIESTANSLNFKIKSLESGRLRINITSKNISNKEVRGEDMTLIFNKFVVNGNLIFDKSRNISFEKPFIFEKNVVKNEVINIELKWLSNNYSIQCY